MSHILRVLVAAAALALFLVFAAVLPAGAQEVEPVVGVDWFDYTTPANVVIIVGLFIPVLTNLITKQVASSQVKSLTTLVLSIVAATIGVLVGDDGNWALREFGNAFLSTFIPAIASYYGFWKHSSLNAAVGTKSANFGLTGSRSGSHAAPPTDETRAA